MCLGLLVMVEFMREEESMGIFLKEILIYFGRWDEYN